jgi:hypothetical protein
MGDDIAMFELTFDGDEVAIVQERHYRLVPAADISGTDLTTYARSEDRFSSSGT